MFRHEDAKLVGAVTSWRMLDRAAGRIRCMPREVAAQFLPVG